MKKISFADILFTFSIALCSSGAAFAQTQSESVRVEKARKSVTDLVAEYSPNVSDSVDENFISNKYLSASQTTWRCHDPKLFQDPDTGVYYVYSTGWEDGVQLRTSTDLIHWTRVTESPLWDPKDISLRYRHMHWDDDFLKWTGFSLNDGTVYKTARYSPISRPQSWAPTVVKQNGKYYMFHGIITDCLTYGADVKPAAAITLCIADKPEGPFVPASEYDSDTYSNSTLVRYVWDRNGQHSQIGYDGCYNTANANWETGFGCIDPEFVMDIATGELMTYKIGNNICYAMTYGSWKGGIALIYVDAETFKPVATVDGTSSFDGKDYAVGDEMDAPLDSVRKNAGTLLVGGKGAAYEGSQLIYNSETGFYYIFVSMGELTFEYRVGVGRSKEITGPYVDTSNQRMDFKNQGLAASFHQYGGKIIGASQLGKGYGWTSPGGQSLIRTTDGKMIFACHTRTNFMDPGQFTLQIRQMFFNEEGWPVLNQNEYYGEGSSLSALTLKEIAGSYDVILTKRSADKSIDATPTVSEKIKIDSDGKVTGKYSGTVTLKKDGHTVVFELAEGEFSGIVMKAVNWNLKDKKDNQRDTVTFTVLNSTSGSGYGEYLFGNKQ